MDESSNAAIPTSGESPYHSSKGNVKDFYALQEKIGIGQPNNNEQDYFPAVDPYFDEHEEINDLLALSEVVPNIIEDKKVGWRMTSTNDECWRSDEHLLETKFRDACPAFVRLLSKQIHDKTQSTESLHAARVALAEEKDMGDEVGQEVGLEEVSSSKFDSEQERNGKDVHENKSNGSGIAIYNAEREDLKAPDVIDTPKTVEDEDEIEKLDGVQQERIEVPGSVENNLELKQCPTQDIEELECDEEGKDEIKNKEETTVDEKSEEVEESKAQFDDSTAPNDEAKAIMNSNLESSGRGVENTPTLRPEEDPAPPTIVTKMTLSLPSFKPATGCTNASDFIVRCFVARLRSGISVVKHGRSRWCKSRLRILHVHPDGSSLSWKPAIGEPTSSKRPPKLDLSNCLEIRHAWSSDPLHQNYTGTSILRSKCETINAHKSFSLIFPRRTVDITAITADQCKVLIEGFSALCFRLQVANLSSRKKNEEDEKISIPTSLGTCASNRQLNIIHIEGA